MNIIEMAKQAGFGIDESPCVLQPYVIQPLHGKIDDELTRFAHLVRAEALEEAAVYFENHWSYEWTDDQVVAAIRQLKDKT
jgi:hypothetical protein